MFNGLPQYSIVKHLAVTYANLVKQIYKSDLPISNAARKQIGIDVKT